MAGRGVKTIWTYGKKTSPEIVANDSSDQWNAIMGLTPKKPTPNIFSDNEEEELSQENHPEVTKDIFSYNENEKPCPLKPCDLNTKKNKKSQEKRTVKRKKDETKQKRTNVPRLKKEKGSFIAFSSTNSDDDFVTSSKKPYSSSSSQNHNSRKKRTVQKRKYVKKKKKIDNTQKNSSNSEETPVMKSGSVSPLHVENNMAHDKASSKLDSNSLKNTDEVEYMNATPPRRSPIESSSNDKVAEISATSLEMNIDIPHKEDKMNKEKTNRSGEDNTSPLVEMKNTEDNQAISPPGNSNSHNVLSITDSRISHSCTEDVKDGKQSNKSMKVTTMPSLVIENVATPENTSRNPVATNLKIEVDEVSSAIKPVVNSNPDCVVHANISNVEHQEKMIDVSVAPPTGVESNNKRKKFVQKRKINFKLPGSVTIRKRRRKIKRAITRCKINYNHHDDDDVIKPAVTYDTRVVFADVTRVKGITEYLGGGHQRTMMVHSTPCHPVKVSNHPRPPPILDVSPVLVTSAALRAPPEDDGSFVVPASPQFKIPELLCIPKKGESPQKVVHVEEKSSPVDPGSFTAIKVAGNVGVMPLKLSTSTSDAQLCVTPIQTRAKSESGCATPAQVCVTPVQKCVTPAQVCVTPVQKCVTPAQVCAKLAPTCVTPVSQTIGVISSRISPSLLNGHLEVFATPAKPPTGRANPPPNEGSSMDFSRDMFALSNIRAGDEVLSQLITSILKEESIVPEDPQQHLKRMSESIMVLDQSLRRSEEKEGKDATAVEKRKILRECGQDLVLTFGDVVKNNFHDSSGTCTKLGEGVYGEVFSCHQGNDQASVAVKVIPIEGDVKINGVLPKRYFEVLPEVIISSQLSKLSDLNLPYSTSSFIKLHRVSCMKGKYPEMLLNAWDDYDTRKTSLNERPCKLNDDQHYMMFVYQNGGVDIEHFQFTNASQAFSVLHQIVAALAVAETQLNFEHRDLHWGNVLVQTSASAGCSVAKSISYKWNGVSHEIKSFGAQAFIIDFTLSRLSQGKLTLYQDLAMDEDLFTGDSQEDFQFEIYRKMQKQLQNRWSEFDPRTNIFWIDYLIDKLLNQVKYRSKKTASHRSAMFQMRKLRHQVLEFTSASHLLTDYFHQL